MTHIECMNKISDFKIYNKFFNNINDVYENTENIVLDMDMNSEHIINQNVNLSIEDIEIIENIIPYRREGSFYCLPHVKKYQIGHEFRKCLFFTRKRWPEDFSSHRFQGPEKK